MNFCKIFFFIIVLFLLTNCNSTPQSSSTNSNLNNSNENTAMNTNIQINNILLASDNFEEIKSLFYGDNWEQNYDKIIELLNVSISLNPNNFEYWEILGELFYRRGKYSDSYYCFQKSLQIFNSPRVKAKLAELIQNAWNANEQSKILAEEVYNEIGENYFRIEVNNLQILAWACYFTGELDKSEKYINLSIINWEANRNPYQMLEYANLMARLGRINSAEESYEKAFNAFNNNEAFSGNPDDIVFMERKMYYEKALMYYNADNKEKADENINKLLEIEPDAFFYNSLAKLIDSMN